MSITHRFAAQEDVDTLICLRFTYLEEDQGALDPGARSILRQQLSSYFPRALGSTLVAVRKSPPTLPSPQAKQALS